jgi:L-threonylcarbamoyladenylate synthase
MASELNTVEINIDDDKNRAIAYAQKIFLSGGTFIYPTDTIYGFGANPFNEDALAKISRLKQRDETKQYILLIDDITTLLKHIEVSDEHHIDFLISLWPNPISVVLRLNKDTAKILGNSTAAFRIPNHYFCRKLIRQLKMPLISTSVNRSGDPPMNDFTEISQEFRNEVDAIFYTAKNQIAVHSTVVDLTGNHPVLLREGRVKFSDIEKRFIINQEQYTKIKK